MSALDRAATFIMALAASSVAVLYIVRGGQGPNVPLAPPSPEPYAEDRLPLVEAVALRPPPRQDGVAVYEFIDVECPFCARFAQTLDSAIIVLGDSLEIRYVNMPLSQHRMARIGAIAIECAFAAGRGQEFVRSVFAHQDSLAYWSWSGYAARVGLTDSSSFRACMENPVVAARVDSSVAVAAALRVRGTPMVMVEQWRFDAAPSADELVSAVRRVAAGRAPK